MNEKKQATSTDLRLVRIRKMSRFLRIVLLFYFAVCGLVFALSFQNSTTSIRLGDLTFASAAEIPAWLRLYAALGAGLYILAVIVFYRLLRLYEKGIIFSAENVSQIRRLGILAVSQGVWGACQPIFERHAIPIPALPLNILFSPWFLVGVLTIIIAWVMDEGRKISEEQELTV